MPIRTEKFNAETQYSRVNFLLPATTEWRTLQDAYRKHIMGVSIEKLGLDELQVKMLQKFESAASPGRSGFQIAQELGWSSDLTCEMRRAGKEAREQVKESKKAKAENADIKFTLVECLKMHLQGITVPQMVKKGGYLLYASKASKAHTLLDQGKKADEIAKAIHVELIEAKRLVRAYGEFRRSQAEEALKNAA